MKGELGFVVSALAIVAAIVIGSADTDESTEDGHVHGRHLFGGTVVQQRKLAVCPAVVRCYNLFFMGSILTTVRCTKDEQCWLRGGGRCCSVSSNPFQGCCAIRRHRTTTAAPTTTTAPPKKHRPCCRHWRCCKLGFRPCCQNGRYGRDKRQSLNILTPTN